MQHNQRLKEPTNRRSALFWGRMRERVARARASVAPSPRAWRGATGALACAALLVWLWGTLPQVTPLAPSSALLIVGLNVLLTPIIAGLLLVLLRGLTALPRLFGWVLATVVILLGTLSAGPSVWGWLLTIALLAVTVSIVGGVLWSIAGGGWSRMRWPKRLVTLTALALSLVVLVGGSAWLLGPGTLPAAIPNAALLGAPVAPLDQADPSQPGPYTVQTLTYGSGRDLHRPEYGADVALTTAPVDASNIVQGWAGATGAARTRAWGFDATALPINGRVWYPQGAGPFPLVLIVHGNGAPEEFSDRGFAYLGELLSSRGFIVASVDQNFLNTGVLDRLGGITGANAARGWLLLEHLRVWHAWNTQSDNPFYNKIDTENIALIGHSRGGEAVALAAAFNRLDRFPDNATLPFRYGYAIRSVVAIAPSDGQYLPMGEKVPLHNVHYLAIQGSHDADVVSFAGLNQYHRVTFDTGEPWIKAALYIYRANHSQFNTTWDQYDVGEGLSAQFINTAALLPAAEQRKVAQVAISAFLEATLRDAASYRSFFRDVRVGSAWLPPTVYLNQYADAATQYFSTYEEDIDVTSTTLPGGSQEGASLAQWDEQHLPLRLGPGDDRAVRLSWERTNGAADPGYTINLPTTGMTLTERSMLRFDVADARSAAVPNTSSAGDAGSLVNFTIEVRDADGDRARLPLSHVAPLQPPIAGQYLKSAALHTAPLSEPILQTYSFPLTDFVAANDAFDPTSLTAISLVFNDTAAGTILLDNIGIAPVE